MHLTTTIRRKLLIGLLLVFVMFGVLAYSSRSGLSSYSRTVSNLRYSIHEAPRGKDLFASVYQLMGPLFRMNTHDPDVTTEERVQQNLQDFRATIGRVRIEVETFRSKLDAIQEQSRVNHQSIYWYLSQIEGRLKDLEESSDKLSQGGPSETVLSGMVHTVEALSSQARQIPDPSDEMLPMLDAAVGSYQWHFRLVRWSTIIGFAALAALVGCGYYWVLRPIRNLHQGALRVAEDADFDYRLDIPTNDEMSQLAEAFNRMTERFQEVTRDLHRQVEERSKQLVQSRKYASMGVLTAGVAHELNNPLASISYAAESIEMRLSKYLGAFDDKSRETIPEYLRMIQNEAERCGKITQQLLNFFRGKGSERMDYDMTAIVRDAISIVGLNPKYKHGEIVFEETKPHYAHVCGDELKQVVLNLLTNGLDAGGEKARMNVVIHEGTDWLEVEFRDFGCGMTAEVLERIYEPFYTTKEPGSGTGLGLSISHRIVSDHGGTLDGTSDGPGKGSIFRLRLPRSQAVVQQHAA